MGTKEFKENLRNTFIGYRHLNGKIRKDLLRMGFVIKRKRKHAILTLSYNDKTYSFAISMTASDDRSGYNIVSTIMNTINQI